MALLDENNELVQIFKLMGHPIRLSIIRLLKDEEFLNVGSIVDALELPQATVSQQLAKLKAGNIVTAQRDGTKVRYSLTNEHVVHIIETLNNEDYEG
ncbi:winged helix-turn-helix transcriptional regulator [Aerococcaceae bacterium DSM 111022]|nr:winged helix-turn-helix transcriptional regulator [Aerococcaceae bacterium DSM 111022]